MAPGHRFLGYHGTVVQLKDAYKRQVKKDLAEEKQLLLVDLNCLHDSNYKESPPGEPARGWLTVADGSPLPPSAYFRLRPSHAAKLEAALRAFREAHARQSKEFFTKSPGNLDPTKTLQMQFASVLLDLLGPFEKSVGLALDHIEYRQQLRKLVVRSSPVRKQEMGFIDSFTASQYLKKFATDQFDATSEWSLPPSAASLLLRQRIFDTCNRVFSDKMYFGSALSIDEYTGVSAA